MPTSPPAERLEADSQRGYRRQPVSIRTAEGGEERGYDLAKKIAGRKRHIAVDTLGLVWVVQDYDRACFVFQKLQSLGRLRAVFADSAYGRNDLPTWVKETLGWGVANCAAAHERGLNATGLNNAEAGVIG